MADTVTIKVYDDLARDLNRVEAERDRLRKENEWLLNRMVCGGPTKESRYYRKKHLQEEMQKKLKEVTP